MRKWKWRVAIVVTGSTLGACAGAEHVSGPGGARFDEHPAQTVPPDSTVQVLERDTPGDSTGGRWGGYVGGGSG